jgi:undecaprenyl-diphosphatase
LSKALDLDASPRVLSNRVSIYTLSTLFALLLLAVYFAAAHGAHSMMATHHGWLTTIDMNIESFLNRWVNRWRLLDTGMLALAQRNLLKGAPIVFLCWAAFFEKSNEKNRAESRAKLAASIPLAIAAVIVARILAKILPFRERPFRTAALHFQVPYGMSTERLYGWSSFPSDHAILFVALSVGVFLASRRLGLLALAYTGLFIIGPRVYLGWHWPTDVLAGALLGAAFACIATIAVYREFVWRWVVKAWRSSPGIFAGCVFLLCYEITDLFDAPVSIMMALLKHKH